MNIERLKQIFDRRFFVFVTLVFLVSFLGGLIWFWSESQAQGERGSFKDLVAKELETEDQESKDRDRTSELGSEEGIDNTSSLPAVLGETTKTVKETTTQTQMSLETDSVSLTSLANEAVLKLEDCLVKNDSSCLYTLAGEDLKTTFGEGGFTEALGGGEQVLEVSIFSGPKVLGEWVEAGLELKYTDKTSEKYTVFFHLEEGTWKLFGTEEIP